MFARDTGQANGSVRSPASASSASITDLNAGNGSQMGKFLKGLGAIFGGGSGRQQRKEQILEQTRATEQQQTAQVQQARVLQEEQQDQEEEISRARRAPKGRRLLLAATGEDGVKATIG